MKSDEFIKIVLANGWEKVRQKGSHIIFKKGTRTYPVPYHKGDEIGKGLEKCNR
jgi:predicted RNA binding protein YcfA (HicA-like mRNA interferase family)